MKSIKIVIPIIVVSFILVWSCSDSDSNNNDVVDSFDRQLMLTNWADNIIIPAYNAFSSEVDNLQTASEAFQANPNESTIALLRQEWEDAYIAWQNVGMFNIGPAETTFFRSFLNTYPTNTASIEANISTNNYNLEDINLNDAQGFPALDYLLFGLADNETDLLGVYTTNENADNYLMYLNNVVERIVALKDNVRMAWENGFRDAFVSNSGSSSNSSTNSLVNDYMEYYEVNFRNGKIGFPSGVFSEGNNAPEKVEAFYKKDLSKRLCLEALNAFQDFFNGKAFGSETTGESLSSYLDFLNTMKDGEDLSSLINNQLNVSRAAINALDDSFYNQINTNNSLMLSAFEELQTGVVLLKSDMFSALSIAVEFNSGDGD